jgi:TonB family protein
MTTPPMLEAVRPGIGETGHAASRAVVELRHETIGRDIFAAPRARTTTAPAVLLALILHGLILVGALAGISDPFGAGGTDLEALSVEVALVPASALESRASRATESVASTAAIDQRDGSTDAAAATASSAPPDPADKPEAEQQREAPQLEPAKAPAHEDTPSPLPTLALTTPEPTPPEPDAVTLPQREPEPTRTEPELLERSAQPSTNSAAAEAGGATSHASDGVNRRAQAAAAASVGSIRAFTKGVVDALGKTRPKGLHHKARGTARVTFAIAEGGGLEFVRVARSSGHDALDGAAVAAVRKASFPVPPSGMTLAQRTYEVPYHFR